MGKLQVGAAMTDFTPLLGTELAGYFTKRPAQDVHDPLRAKAVVLDNGDTTIALCVCDLIVLPNADVVRVKARVQELCGLPPENVLISCTHTHTGPATAGLLGADRDDAYVEWATLKIADAVRLAQVRLQPARLGYAAGSCPTQVHNRRWHMKDGTVRMNPGYQNPDAIRPAGPVDPEVGVLAIETPEGRPLAVIANYALHYVGGPGLAVSADYFACFGQALQPMVGAEFVAILANGCCGDINNCDFANPPPKPQHPYHQMERVARIVAAEALRAWQEGVEFTEEVELGAALEVLDCARKQIPPEQLERDRAKLAAGEKWDDMEWIWARERLLVHELPGTIEAPVHALRINDLGIVGLPGEVFVEHGLAVKERTPFAEQFVIELANGYVGYVPTKQALAEGSYETETARSSLPAAGEGERMVETAVGLLGKLKG